MATVDIIIPAFNAAEYLPFALESVSSQTFDDWQILLVDDGSTDNTADVVAPFLDRKKHCHPRFNSRIPRATGCR
jgi:glycosyltransferase involved in cell wall biosynthesis